MWGMLRLRQRPNIRAATERRPSNELSLAQDTLSPNRSSEEALKE